MFLDKNPFSGHLTIVLMVPMMGIKGGTLILILGIFSLLVTLPHIEVVKAETRTIVVPDDYSTIQEAINSAADGDTIYIREGTYMGDLNITKHISLKGQNPESTIINGCIFIRTSNVTINSLKLMGFGRWEQLKTFANGYGILTLSGKSHSYGSLQETWGTTIKNCIFENWIIPILLMSGDGERIINNTILNSDQGIDVGTFNNVIAYNTISCGGNGICLGSQYITGNLVYGNHISDAEKGIFINCFNYDNDIIGNTIAGCQEGIHLGAAPERDYPSSGNLFFHNNLLDNSKQVLMTAGSSDIWDNGYPSGGNYWSDYNGTDADGDGIGDVPYIIDEYNQDNYPLMLPATANPSFSYNLKVDSVPSGVRFTADNTTCTTPWSETYNEGTTVSLTMPEFTVYENENLTWRRWSDGNPNRTRTVTINNNRALTAIFTLEYMPPLISVLSPENKTYSAIDVPLEYTVDRYFYNTTYSLDGQENVTIIGNTTLAGLSKGPHKIIVYIEETPGNISASETILFTVAISSSDFSILSPKNITYNTADIPLTFTENETFYFSSYSLDGQPNYIMQENTTLFDLADGAHQLILYINSTDSITGGSTTVHFTVNTTVSDTTPPVHAHTTFNVTIEQNTYVIETSSNSSVSELEFNQTLKEIRFYVDGASGTNGLCNITIPQELMSGNFSIYNDDTLLVKNVDYTETFNGTHYLFSIQYDHSTHMIEIIATNVIPEFPSWAILPLLLTATLLAIIYKKRLTKVHRSY